MGILFSNVPTEHADFSNEKTNLWGREWAYCSKSTFIGLHVNKLKFRLCLHSSDKNLETYLYQSQIILIHEYYIVFGRITIFPPFASSTKNIFRTRST